MTAGISTDNSILAGQHWDPVIPKTTVSSKAVLDEYSLAWLPGIRKIVIKDMSDLPVWVTNEFAGRLGHPGTATMGNWATIILWQSSDRKYLLLYFIVVALLQLRENIKVCTSSVGVLKAALADVG